MTDTLKPIPTSSDSLLAFLSEIGISYKNTPHPKANTVEEAEVYWKDIAGMHCKNLFCKDAKGQLWLIVVPAHKRVNLKTLPNVIGSKRLSFGNEQLLFETLGVYAGSVTPFAVINDKDNRVKVVLDSEMMMQEKINYHPLENLATTTITPDDLRLFMQKCNHIPQIVPVTEIESL